MRLLKIILVIFAVYFIRRFMQMYRVMKRIQEQQKAQAEETSAAFRATTSKAGVVNANFRVID